MVTAFVYRVKRSAMETNFNNSVRDARGECVGFRCHECGGVFQTMWGNICNGCRETERRHQEVLTAMRAVGKSGG